MKKIIILITACILIQLYSHHLSALTHSGKNLYFFGDSPEAIGRGSTGVASFGQQFFYMNPAAISKTERFGLGLQYGTIPVQTNYYNPDISVKIPTSYGIFGTSVRTFHIPDYEDFKTGYALSFGGAKPFTENLMLGISINIFYGNSGSDLFYTGATLGTIYDFDIKFGKNGFGFYKPKLGFAINFGLPIGEDKDFSNFNSLILGYNFIFYNTVNFDIGFYNEFTAINGYSEFPVKTGLQFEIYYNFILRFGFIYPQYTDYGDISFGAGYKFKSENFAGSVDYSISHYRDMKFVHNVGLVFEFGELDTLPPHTGIKPDNKYISPNNDGIQDYVIFDVTVEDTSMIKGWKLDITDPGNKLIRKYRMSERDITGGLTVKDFFKRFIQKKESTVVPEHILWDGKDSKGNIVPDNIYSYSFNAWDERDNISVLKKGYIFVDNTSPEISLKTADLLFSPNGDNKKDNFEIYQEIKTSASDIWTAGFKNSQGKIIKKYNWSGSNIPNRVVWDGKDDIGVEQPEGLYYYFIKTTDMSGNSAKSEINEISLTRKFETADIKLNSTYFSNLKDKDLKLFPYLSNNLTLDNWKVLIKNKRKKIIKSISGETIMPALLLWDGKDKNGEKLNDGIYYIQLLTQFKNGNTPRSFEKKLIVDSTPPDLETEHYPELFSPDGDGENDMLTIKNYVREEFGIDKWDLIIYTPSGTIFKTFNGKGKIAEIIKWNGLGNNMDIVESAADYSIELQATDLAGNFSKSERIKLEVDILVLVTERGLKMRISNIHFDLNSSKLTKKGLGILNRACEILKKYKKYKIIIEGHTDDTGEEEKNLILSEKRAESVLNYLIENGMDKNRLKFIGMGETVPVYPNRNKENRRRNRRVEFLLLKNDK